MDDPPLVYNTIPPILTADWILNEKGESQFSGFINRTMFWRIDQSPLNVFES
jgi:hypothetical protein